MRIVIDQQNGATDQISSGYRSRSSAAFAGKLDTSLCRKTRFHREPLRRLDAFTITLRARCAAPRPPPASFAPVNTGRSVCEARRRGSSRTSNPLMSGSLRSRTTQSLPSPARQAAWAPLSAVTISMSSWPSNSLMLADWAFRPGGSAGAARLRKVSDARECRPQALGACRLCDERERAARQRVLAIFL